jgi:hypothetical protein
MVAPRSLADNRTLPDPNHVLTLRPELVEGHTPTPRFDRFTTGLLQTDPSNLNRKDVRVMIEIFARAGSKAWNDAAQGQDPLNLGITR